MLFNFSVWLLLSLVAAGVGLAVIGAEALAAMRDSRQQGEDLLLLAAWIGVALIAVTAFALVLILPLNLPVSALILAVAVLVSCRGWFRVSGSPAIHKAWKPTLATLCVLAVILAERSTQVGNLEDAGGYHWSLIRWYRETGVPVGLGLFQWRLGTHSSWLALTALFDHGPMVSRVGNLVNGLILLWVLAHAFVALSRIVRGVAGKGDVFLASGLLLVLPSMMGWEMRLSPSPDIPVILLCIVVSWAWLQFRGFMSATSCGLPLIALAAAAVTVKLSALPLLIAVILVTMWESRREPMQWGPLALAAMLPPGILVVASSISTGCALFPSAMLCFDAPWGVGADTARQYSQIVNSTAPRNITDWVIVSGLALAAILLRRRSVFSGPEWGVAAIAVIGIGFTGHFAPTTRFGLGYLVLLPSLAVACYASAIGGVLGRLLRSVRMILSALLIAAVAIGFALPLYKEFIYQKLRTRQFESFVDRKTGDASINELNPYWYLVPNRIAYGGPFIAARGYDFAYDTSTVGTCWDHKLPCASNPELSFIPLIRLRDQARGIGAGFSKRDQP